MDPSSGSPEDLCESGKEVAQVKEALKEMIAKLGPTYEAPMMIDVETIVADWCIVCKTGGGASE